jgi:plastocyanin/sugar lactone lactonase YvrE
MHRFHPQVVPFVFIFLFCIAPLVGVAQDATPAAADLLPGVEVVASGLTNPRGFTWDANGNLYLALAGTGGADQVVVEGTPLPFMVGPSSSIVTVDDGCAVPLAEGIGSLLWTDPGWIWGAMDVAVFGDQLYALLGAGGAEGGSPNGVYRVQADGTVELVADVAGWLNENPPAYIPFDYDPNGSLFDLEATSEGMLVSEAVGGRLLLVTPEGAVTEVADLSEDHMVPTGVAPAPDGGAYVNHETVVPFPDGAATVIHVAPDGSVTDAWTGLTAGTDLAMGPDGLLYAAEMATGNLDEPPYLNPGTGRVVRQTGPDSLEPVVVDAEYPVYVGFGPDGALYLTYPAFGPAAGAGQGALLRIDLSADLPVSLAGLGELAPTCTDGAAPTAGTPTAAGSTVTIVDFAFMPQELTVAAGTTVAWTNEDWAPHTVTAGDGSFDSGRLDQGATFEHTFAERGTYAYFCTFHPGMTGTITVE